MQSLTENLWSFYVICLRTKVFWTILPLGKESLFSNLDTLPFRLAFAGHLIKYVPTLLDCNELLYFAQPLSISDYLKNLSKQFWLRCISQVRWQVIFYLLGKVHFLNEIYQIRRHKKPWGPMQYVKKAHISTGDLEMPFEQSFHLEKIFFLGKTWHGCSLFQIGNCLSID